MNFESKSFYLFTGMVVLVFILGFTSIAISMQTKEKTQEIRTQAAAPVVLNHLPEDPNKQELNAELVEGFPNFPVYPGAELEMSVKMTQATENKGYTAVWIVREQKGLAVVSRWYIQELKAQGWTFAETPTDFEQGELFVNGSRGDAHMAMEFEVEPDGSFEVMVDFPLTFE